MTFASSLSWSICICATPSCYTSTSQTIKLNAIKLEPYIGRRVGLIALVSSLVLSGNRTASGFELRMTVPDQTAEEAEGMIRGHAQGLLDVKDLLELQDWREAQRELRRNSGYLRQDIYTIIQKKEGNIRPLLRKLYFDLFNNVSKLDYAAREKDVVKVWECYNSVTTVLNDILSRILD